MTVIFAHFPSHRPSPPDENEATEEQVPMTVAKSAARWAGASATRRFADAVGRAMLLLFSVGATSAILAMLADAPRIALLFTGSALTAGLTLILTNIVEEKLS